MVAPNPAGIQLAAHRTFSRSITTLDSLLDKDLAKRIEAYVRGERRPVRLTEIRKALGIDASESRELRKLLNEDGRFYKVGPLWYARKSPLRIRVRFCPNCGCKAVKFEGGFYRCPNCEIRFHFTWLA